MRPLFCVLAAAAVSACVGAPADSPGASPAAAPASQRAPRARAKASPKGPPILQAHNRYRARHCVPPLRWSQKLARTAQRWADELAGRGCAFGHSRTPHGENLAAGTASVLDPQRVVDMWYREVDDYDFGSGGFSLETGHFTQLVWRSTERLGCGTATCQNGMEIWVCHYDPPGNVQGLFGAQVQPARCH